MGDVLAGGAGVGFDLGFIIYPLLLSPDRHRSRPFCITRPQADISKHVTKHGVAQFRFKPGAFGRHDPAGVGDGHQVLHPGGEEGEGARVFFRFDKFLQFRRPADAADKMDALAGARIVHAKNRGQDVLLQQRNIQAFDRLRRGANFGAKAQCPPFAFEV